ncbi:MAG: sugar phosphate nucleotidyltransferase [Candidatus Hydrogenedentota bacterium]
MESTATMQRLAIIMAGGSGERFWPLSRQQHPKQLLRLTSETKNMLEEAVDRLAPLIASEHIFVVTGRHLLDSIIAAEIGIPKENVIAEPCKRDTAGCLCYAAAAMRARYGGNGSNLSMAVVTADHQIGDPDLFRQTVDASLHIAETQGSLVTHGIVPDRPDVGYGYIQGSSNPGESVQVGGITLLKAEAFHEKPDASRAQDFLDAGNFFWNSGMFFWRVDSFVEELRNARPEMAEIIDGMASSIDAGDDTKTDALFESLEGVSIDYALMEHARDVIVARAEYPWDDVGSWLALDRTRESDSDGNVTFGDPVLIDTTNSIVYNGVGKDDMAVSVIGLEDVVVVVSKDGVLVTPKDQTQKVKHAVAALKARGSKQV